MEHSEQERLVFIPCCPDEKAVLIALLIVLRCALNTVGENQMYTGLALNLASGRCSRSSNDEDAAVTRYPEANLMTEGSNVTQHASCYDATSGVGPQTHHKES